MLKESLIKNKSDDITTLCHLHSTGPTTIDGWSISYDDEFPKILSNYISPNEFYISIEAINQTLEDYFPCPPCFICGYICCISTFGISKLFINPCSNELRKNIDIIMDHINHREAFRRHGIQWEFKNIKDKKRLSIEITKQSNGV